LPHGGKCRCETGRTVPPETTQGNHVFALPFTPRRTYSLRECLGQPKGLLLRAFSLRSRRDSNSRPSLPWAPGRERPHGFSNLPARTVVAVTSVGEFTHS
jgi:hypothetical protein